MFVPPLRLNLVQYNKYFPGQFGSRVEIDNKFKIKSDNKKRKSIDDNNSKTHSVDGNNLKKKSFNKN